MTEPTRFAPSPIPAEPSTESVRLLHRVRLNRKLQERRKRLRSTIRLLRSTTTLVALAARAPKGGTARNVRYDDVEGRLVTAQDADPANGVLMWVHGGGFVSGSPRLEQQLAAAYAAPSRIPVFLPKFRLAPEHPFPAAADDVLAAYKALLHQGFSPETIRLAGVSSGGALATGLLANIDREGLPMPSAVLLLSPLLDLSLRMLRERDAVAPDPFNAPHMVALTTAAYLAGTPVSHPRLSLLGCGMRTRPPTLVQVGGTEFLVTEAAALGAAMGAAGASCEVQVWPGQIHGFQGLGKIPEARAAVDYGARFLAGQR